MAEVDAVGPCWNYCEVVNQAIMRCPGDCILLYSIQEELYECFSLHVRSYAIILHRGSDVAEIPEMRNSLPCIFFEYLHASCLPALLALLYHLEMPWPNYLPADEQDGMVELLNGGGERGNGNSVVAAWLTTELGPN